MPCLILFSKCFNVVACKVVCEAQTPVTPDPDDIYPISSVRAGGKVRQSSDHHSLVEGLVRRLLLYCPHTVTSLLTSQTLQTLSLSPLTLTLGYKNITPSSALHRGKGALHQHISVRTIMGYNSISGLKYFFLAKNKYLYP